MINLLYFRMEHIVFAIEYGDPKVQFTFKKERSEGVSEYLNSV